MNMSTLEIIFALLPLLVFIVGSICIGIDAMRINRKDKKIKLFNKLGTFCVECKGEGKVYMECQSSPGGGSKYQCKKCNGKGGYSNKLLEKFCDIK